jgi:predicted lipoprotein with Yx(FWY)xxD motif
MQGLERRRTRSLRGPKRITAVITAVVVAVVAGVATAGTFNSLGTAKRTVKSKQVTIVVDGRGVTVYELGGESAARLKCLTRQCLNTWPPMKVGSKNTKVKKAAGVPGRVSIFTRVRGKLFQVMLDNHPLYYYSGDKGKAGSTKGQGINSFGGSWHVVRASG